MLGGMLDRRLLQVIGTTSATRHNTGSMSTMVLCIFIPQVSLKILTGSQGYGASILKRRQRNDPSYFMNH